MTAELPSVEQIQKWRIEGLMKHCPSATPYINAAHNPSEPDQVFMWREGFTHVFNMLVARDDELASLTAQLARCREETAEGFKPEFKKHAWLRSEAILRGAFKSGIDIDAEYVRALAPTTGDGR